MFFRLPLSQESLREKFSVFLPFALSMTRPTCARGGRGASAAPLGDDPQPSSEPTAGPSAPTAHPPVDAPVGPLPEEADAPSLLPTSETFGVAAPALPHSQGPTTHVWALGDSVIAPPPGRSPIRSPPSSPARTGAQGSTSSPVRTPRRNPGKRPRLDPVTPTRMPGPSAITASVVGSSAVGALPPVPLGAGPSAVPIPSLTALAVYDDLTPTRREVFHRLQGNLLTTLSSDNTAPSTSLSLLAAPPSSSSVPTVAPPIPLGVAEPSNPLPFGGLLLTFTFPTRSYPRLTLPTASLGATDAPGLAFQPTIYPTTARGPHPFLTGPAPSSSSTTTRMHGEGPQGQYLFASFSFSSYFCYG